MVTGRRIMASRPSYHVGPGGIPTNKSERAGNLAITRSSDDSYETSEPSILLRPRRVRSSKEQRRPTSGARPSEAQPWARQRKQGAEPAKEQPACELLFVGL